MPSILAVGAIAGAAIGAGTSLIGADMQADATRDATNANIQANRETNALNYQRWLETQGVGADGAPVNVSHPRWMTVQVSKTGTGLGPRRLIKKGSSATDFAPQAQASPYAAPAASLPASSQPSSPGRAETSNTLYRQ